MVIGAQVGYPDLAGFGRRFLDMTPADLMAAVLYQIGALDGLARASGSRVRYVKPHGALYNTTVDHDAQATAVVNAVIAYDPALPVLGLPGSALLRIAADRELRPVTEYFVDRGYTTAGRLIDAASQAPCSTIRRRQRNAPSALPEKALPSPSAHGDSPNAMAMARAVRDALEAAAVTIAPFVDPP